MANKQSPWVDILDLNTFTKTGITKPIHEAWAAGDWIGSFNLWIVRTDVPGGAILYQQRTFKARWAPGLLDVSVGGHYEAGDNLADGLREAQEEIGKSYWMGDLLHIGKKVYLRDDGARRLRYAVDVCLTVDNAPLQTYTLQKTELEGLYVCPISDLLLAHTKPGYTFVAEGITFSQGEQTISTLQVNKDLFPYNWDNYHLKMAMIAKRFIDGDKHILY